MAETDHTQPEHTRPHEELGITAINGATHQFPPDPEQEVEFPLLAAVQRYWEEDPEYATASDTERAGLRPALTQKFIREETLRRYPGTRGLLPVPTIERNLHRFQKEHGVLRPKDRIKEKMRAGFQYEAMSHAAAFSGMPELRVAYELDDEIVRSEDMDLLDTIQTLIAAYGMTINTLAKKIYPTRNG